MSATALEVGKQLVAFCQKGQFEQAMEHCYSPKIVSIEAHGDEKMPARMEGMQAVRAKGQWWQENHTVHGAEVHGPYPHGNRFIVNFKMDVTPKVGPMAGKRITLDEAALYTVEGGKIVQEEFFYGMGG